MGRAGCEQVAIGCFAAKWWATNVEPHSTIYSGIALPNISAGTLKTPGSLLLVCSYSPTHPPL
jgi:hypothetical protein